MAFGFGLLRLAPDAFWAMTPRELAAAAGRYALAHVASPTREELRGLMETYPDEEMRDA